MIEDNLLAGLLFLKLPNNNMQHIQHLSKDKKFRAILELQDPFVLESKKKLICVCVHLLLASN